jgi:hypothetical protein
MVGEDDLTALSIDREARDRLAVDFARPLRFIDSDEIADTREGDSDGALVRPAHNLAA